MAELYLGNLRPDMPETLSIEYLLMQKIQLYDLQKKGISAPFIRSQSAKLKSYQPRVAGQSKLKAAAQPIVNEQIALNIQFPEIPVFLSNPSQSGK